MMVGPVGRPGGEGVGTVGGEDARTGEALTALTHACGESVEAGGSGTESGVGDDGDSRGRSGAGRVTGKGRGSDGTSVWVAADTRACFFFFVVWGTGRV